ncbi:hypothetical protein [Candidatus Poriferisodalis sp.]|uniref:hypothetical protein n=1 Tax=Candidatus Poriferisodalis sp. TaxID=3101277 RepID=UPI003B5C7BF6
MRWAAAMLLLVSACSASGGESTTSAPLAGAGAALEGQASAESLTALLAEPLHTHRHPEIDAALQALAGADAVDSAASGTVARAEAPAAPRTAPDAAAPPADERAPAGAADAADTGTAPLLLAVDVPAFAPVPADVDGETLMDDRAELERFVLAHGPTATVVALKEVELATGRDCHDTAHEVGHIAWEHFGAAAFATVGHDCHAGALHGTIELMFAQRGTARLAQDVSAVCAGPNPFLVHQCLHGVGHGLMAWTSYELPEALGLCDLLPTAQNRDSCYGGVYMENGIGGVSGRMGHTTEYISTTDPHFPCNVLAEQYWPGCYFWQSSNLFYFGWSTDAVMEVCGEAAWNSTQACYMSTGRDLGSIHRDDPAVAAADCRLAATEERIAWCFQGAALSRFTEPANAPFSAQLCTLADRADGEFVADSCWEMLLRDAPHIFPDEPGLREFCDTIDIARRRQACHGKADA